MTSEPLLSISGLSKTFPGQLALSDVNLTVCVGEVHAIVGENGSGKSTLVKILAGYHDPDPGSEIEFSDGDPNAIGAIGFVHQDLALIDALDACDNIALGRGFALRRGRVDTRSERKHAAELMARLGRAIDLTAPLGELPSVDRSLVAMARALDGLPERAVLVLDEPTAALPSPEVRRLFAAVDQIRARGGGILYISHRLDEVLEIADRVTVLRDGRCVATVRTSELEHDDLIELMLGHALEQEQRARSGGAAAPAIEIESLRGGTVADFSTVVRKGEVVGVAGLVGSGREDLALALVGALAGAAGVVKVEGTPLRRRSPRSCMDAGIALVPADRARLGAILEHSVSENITLPLLKPLVGRFRIQQRRERREVTQWIDRVGLVPREPEKALGLLSGGNQQKAVLARWLRTDPKVLVLDEPTQGVDVGAKAAIHRLLGEAVERGLGLLVCTAETEDLVDLCDRVIVMRDGRAAAELSGAELTDARIVRETVASERMVL